MNLNSTSTRLSVGQEELTTKDTKITKEGRETGRLRELPDFVPFVSFVVSIPRWLAGGGAELRSPGHSRRSARGPVVLLASSLLVTVVLSVAVRAQEGSGVRTAELTLEAERSIQQGLRYLLEHQRKDGSWGGKHRVGVTALTLMAFMVKGHFPERAPYNRQLTAGLNYLLAAARHGGGYMGQSMYEHGLATLALSEVWGMSERSAEIRGALKRAVEIILRSQNRQGGWRYQPVPSEADISVTVMQIVALNSSREAGVLVPDTTIRKAIEYVRSCQNEKSGGFGYQHPRDEGFARTAAGVTSLMMCGERSSESVRKGLDYLRKSRAESFKRDQWFFYGHYYAAQAVYQAGESWYQEWYPHIRDALVKRQSKDGGWGQDHATPMAIMILGVPYRFLPVYQR